VIDWKEDATQPPALAWGFRWDGTATGATMLKAIVADDPRLFAKLGGTAASPSAVYGLGYDADGDGVFGIDDNTTFDAQGFAFTPPADLAVATDADDHYAEGWFTGFWHYGVAASNPYGGGSWSDTPAGMASRALVDGAWDSWTYTPVFDFTAFAENPTPAPSPYPPGDFDHDGHVTASDYTRWRETLGSSMQLDADGNHNGIVDAADYIVWRRNVGGQSAALGMQSNGVPEPAAAAMVGVIWLIRFLMRRNER
jgi:hypothetical protein